MNHVIIKNIPKEFQKYIQMLNLSKEQLIIESDGNNKGVYFINSGKVAVKKYLLNGEHIFLKELQEGNCFGEMELFSDRDGTYEITTLTEVSLSYLPREIVQKWMQKDFQVIEYLFEELNDKLQYSSNYIVEQKQGTTYEHLLNYLEQLPKNEWLNINKSELAVTLNTSLRNLNRAILKGREEGIIEWKKGRIKRIVTKSV
ncbi:Crp/Fnr family transcriptional regulator [Vagococcus fluvialis]|uniref:Crp/Fnr family transcriptional regulator n=1 Tax=Vagococcus fluvialis TaxID=2738 RepID=UPI003B58E618